MNNKKEQIIAQCYHCGNKGLMNIKYEVNQQFGGDYENEFGDYQHDFEEHFSWKLLSCPVCNFLTLYQVYTDESMQVPYGEDFRQMYDKKIDINEVNRKLAEIMPRQQQIREELEEIIKELEVDYHE